MGAFENRVDRVGDNFPTRRLTFQKPPQAMWKIQTPIVLPISGPFLAISDALTMTREIFCFKRSATWDLSPNCHSCVSLFMHSFLFSVKGIQGIQICLSYRFSSEDFERIHSLLPRRFVIQGVQEIRKTLLFPTDRCIW